MEAQVFYMKEASDPQEKAKKQQMAELLETMSGCDLSRLSELLKDGYDPKPFFDIWDIYEESDRVPILKAINNNDFITVDLLLKYTDPNYVYASYNNRKIYTIYTSLTLAIEKHNNDMVRFLLSHGSTPHQMRFYTPNSTIINISSMKTAVQNGNIDAVKLLHSLGVSVNVYLESVYLEDKQTITDYDVYLLDIAPSTRMLETLLELGATDYSFKIIYNLTKVSMPPEDLMNSVINSLDTDIIDIKMLLKNIILYHPESSHVEPILKKLNVKLDKVFSNLTPSYTNNTLYVYLTWFNYPDIVLAYLQNTLREDPTSYPKKFRKTFTNIFLMPYYVFKGYDSDFAHMKTYLVDSIPRPQYKIADYRSLMDYFLEQVNYKQVRESVEKILKLDVSRGDNQYHLILDDLMYYILSNCIPRLNEIDNEVIFDESSGLLRLFLKYTPDLPKTNIYISQLYEIDIDKIIGNGWENDRILHNTIKEINKSNEILSDFRLSYHREYAQDHITDGNNFFYDYMKYPSRVFPQDYSNEIRFSFFNPSVVKIPNQKRYLSIVRISRQNAREKIVGIPEHRCHNKNIDICDTGDFIAYENNFSSKFYVSDNTDKWTPIDSYGKAEYLHTKSGDEVVNILRGSDIRLLTNNDIIYGYSAFSEKIINLQNGQVYRILATDKDHINRSVVSIETVKYNTEERVSCITVLDWFRQINENGFLSDVNYHGRRNNYNTWMVNFVRQFYDKKGKPSSFTINYIATKSQYNFSHGESGIDGITPMFSFGTPMIDIMYEGRPAKFGVGHIKIHTDNNRHPYKNGSHIQKFRHNLHDQMSEYYNVNGQCKYKKYWRSNCAGYSYLMYFYILHNYNENGTYDTMLMSDAYLPWSLNDFQDQEKYKFDLFFPVGLIYNDGFIIVTGGYGDYYPLKIEVNLGNAIDMCRHDFSNIDMSDYQYYLWVSKGDNSIIAPELKIALNTLELNINASSSYASSSYASSSHASLSYISPTSLAI